MFWVPLAATWLMMSTEGPFLSAIIARLPDAKFNLAAYGVAFAFALLVESPIIMIMSAATKLVENGKAYVKLRNFTNVMNGAVTLGTLIAISPPVFNWVAYNVIELPPEVAELTHWAFIILLPWPGAIGYRRFYHGVLIRHDRTRLVAYGTVIRLSSMAITALLLYYFTKLPGAIIGTSALSAGVVGEAIASRFMAHRLVQELMADYHSPQSETFDLSYGEIFKFYYPLALTPMISMGTHPMVTFFLGQGRFPIESLAVFPVIHSLTFIFRSLGLSFMEVVVAISGRGAENRIPLRNFMIILAVSASLGLGLIAFTPAAEFWYHTISGLSPELTGFALLPTQVFLLLPALSVLMSYQRGVLVNARSTLPLTWAIIVEVGCIFFVLSVLIFSFNWIGAVAAATALITGRFLANLYLAPPYLRAMKDTPVMQKEIADEQMSK